MTDIPFKVISVVLLFYDNIGFIYFCINLTPNIDQLFNLLHGNAINRHSHWIILLIYEQPSWNLKMFSITLQ